MAIRKYKPTTPGRRGSSVADFAEVTRTTPEKSLLEPIKKSGGRDNHGHIAMRRRGGGHKRQYRIIDFKRNKHGVGATVTSVEYDPNRSARLALLHYSDGEKAYILAPVGLRVGDKVVAGADAERHQRQRVAEVDRIGGVAEHLERTQLRQAASRLDGHQAEHDQRHAKHLAHR